MKKITAHSFRLLLSGLFFMLMCTPSFVYSQHLTISNSGGDVGPISGTNWGISDNVLYVGNSGSASINTSVITSHLQNNGDLTINLPGQSGTGRNIYINNTIAYSGSSARTLTFQSGNDIVFANAVGITSATASLNVVLRAAITTGSPDNGSVKMDGINIDTKGGHLWVGGGASTTTWNGLNVGNSSARTYLDDVAGISVVGSTIASGGGKIYMYAQSWNTTDDDGVNYGINVENSNVSSGAGDINFAGGVYGRYNNGIGMRVNGASATSITSTTGAITIYGYGTDATTNGNLWRTATMINGSVSIKSVSGNIAVTGEAAFASPVNDKEGLVIADGSAICSQTGNITLNGTNTLESSGQYSNSIRFAAANAANSIRIGYDGTNAYSGNITIEGNSIYQRSTHVGAGSIAVQTTGTLTIQPTGTAFTYMRAGNDGAGGSLTFDNDWNFGTNLGGFVYGKTTNTTGLTYSNALTTRGPITIYAGAIVQNGAFSTTSASGHITLLSKTHITNSNATTITTQGGNVLFASNVDDATDGESTTNGYIQLRAGITVNSNGGNITFGGGNTAGSDYALGSSDIAYTEGIRFDAVIALNSGGGNIALRGKSYAMGVYTDWGASGVGFYFFSAATGTINSGTGTITIDGYSQTNTSTYAAGFYCMHNLTITSANTTSNAINITGKATGASGEAWGIESESTLSVLATGIGGGITINTSKQLPDNFDAVFRGETNILAVSGPINLKTGQLSGTTNGYLYLNGHMYLGSKAGSAVTSSSSNINMQVDRYYYANGALPKLATSGSVTIQPNGTSFGADIYTSYFNFNQNGQTMTGFTFGKSGNTFNAYLNSVFAVAGPINVYGGYVWVSSTITSSGNSDILLKGITNSGACVNISGGITKSSGTGTLLMQGHGRVINSGTISATGTAVLNLVMWSDYDGDNVGGGSTLNGGSVSTNGGHVWMGGSNSNGGSYIWNGLTVGDGPSTGAASANCHAIDLFGPITTGGGDVLLWASNNGGCGISGIQSDGTRHINAGSGDITLIAYQTGGAIELTSTGVISLLPHAGSYASALTLGGTLTSGNFSFNTSHYNGMKINSIANVGGLTVGKYEGMLSSGTPVVLGNTSNVSFSTNTNIGGPIIVYGGTIALDANLTTTNNGDITLYTDNAIAGLSAQRNITAAGSFNYIPRSDSFSAPVTYPITNLNLISSGLLIGKPTNTANITFGSATSIAGPITAYGGTITLNADLTTTNNGDISLYTDNPLGGLSTPRTLTAAGAFKYIPRGTTFSADVTYPIANLTATSTGLTIGNATNDKNITINADVTGGAGIELYGNNVNINSNLTTTGTSAIMHLKGNTIIAAGKTITSGGNFTHDGNLLFKSDATSTAAFGTLGGTFTTVSGLATTERYVPSKRGWRLLTAPLKGATNNTIPANWQGVNDEGLLFFSPSTYQSQAMTGYTTGGGMPNIWKYNSDETQWQSIPNLTTENLFTSTGNNGFLVFATGPSNSTNIASGATETTLRPEGQLITGNVTHSLTADKYHLIGNPYASPLHTEAMVQANANTKVFMVDPTLGNVGGYVTYDGSNWAPEPAINDKYIQSGQGFFVRSASNPTFTISESHKVVGNSNAWFDRASSSSNASSNEDISVDKIRVLLYKQLNSQWQLADGILAVNSATGNNDVDATDTEKMSNFNENIGFRNGTSTLAIEYRGLPTIGTIQPMRLTGTTVQPYQLRVKTENYSNSDLQPYVEDTQTGVLTLIPIDGSEVVVHFTGIAATTTAPDSRFRIVYPATLSSDDPTTSLSVGIYPNPVEDKMFTIVLANQDETTQYTLTNLLGQQVQQGKLDTLQNTVSVASLQGGVYVLQVVQSGKTFTTKLIIK